MEGRGRPVSSPGRPPEALFVLCDVRDRSSGQLASKEWLLFLFLVSDDLTQHITFCSLSEGGTHKG